MTNDYPFTKCRLCGKPTGEDGVICTPCLEKKMRAQFTGKAKEDNLGQDTFVRDSRTSG